MNPCVFWTATTGQLLVARQRCEGFRLNRHIDIRQRELDLADSDSASCGGLRGFGPVESVVGEAVSADVVEASRCERRGVVDV